MGAWLRSKRAWFLLGAATYPTACLLWPTLPVRALSNYDNGIEALNFLMTLVYALCAASMSADYDKSGRLAKVIPCAGWFGIGGMLGQFATVLTLSCMR